MFFVMSSYSLWRFCNKSLLGKYLQELAGSHWKHCFSSSASSSSDSLSSLVDSFQQNHSGKSWSLISNDFEAPVERACHVHDAWKNERRAPHNQVVGFGIFLVFPFVFCVYIWEGFDAANLFLHFCFAYDKDLMQQIFFEFLFDKDLMQQETTWCLCSKHWLGHSFRCSTGLQSELAWSHNCTLLSELGIFSVKYTVIS